MQLVSNRLILSPFDNSDKALFIELSMCPEIMKHVYDPFTYDEAKEAFIEKSKPWTITSNGWLSLGITEISSGEKLGNIGLKIVDHQAKLAEVGFMLKDCAQGKGFGREALSLIKEYAFTKLNLSKLIAICSVSNEGSYRLLEKSGFVREDRLDQNTIVNNNFVDDYVYGLCKP